MSDQAYSPHSTFQRVLFRDTLDELFRCGQCQATLVGALVLGRVQDGQLIDVPCPQCNRLWAFKRLDSALLTQQQLTIEDLETAREDAPHRWAAAATAATHCDPCGRELPLP